VRVDATSFAVAGVDARPVAPVSTDTVWDEAVNQRDRLAAAITAALDHAGWKVLLLKSQNGNYPAWIRLEAWIRNPDQPIAHQRVEFELIIDARPFHKHHLVYTARAKRGKRSIAVIESKRFSEDAAVEWALYALGGQKPSRYRPFVDWLLRSVGAFIPPLRPRHNPIAPRFRNRIFDLRLLFAVLQCAILGVGLLERTYLGAIALALGAIVVLGALALLFLPHRYRQYDWVTPRSSESPRMLGHVDSWHAVLDGVASDARDLTQRIVAKLKANSASGFSTRRERFGYRTTTGYEERERLVVSHGQGYVHIHMHPVGHDLFVGWQAHLNWAQWSETSPVAQRDEGSYGIVYRDLKPSWYVPGEFDLIDLDSLSAVVHAVMEREIKALFEERLIDQQVDFEINRGDRGNALDARKAWPERSRTRSRRSNVIFAAGGIRRIELGEMQLAPVDVRPAGGAVGVAAIPAFVFLPILVALGYLGLDESGSLPLHRLDLGIPPRLPLTFFPLLHLPFAVVLAFGLWLYAGVRLLHALTVVALVETFAFGLSYLYQVALSQFLVQHDFAASQISLLASAGAIGLSGICYLLAGSFWAAALREPGCWLAAIVLGTLWGAGAILATREFGLTGTVGTLVEASPRSFMAACIGYWLWHTQLLPRAPATGSAPAPRPTAHRATGETVVGARWRSAAAGLLFTALGTVALLLSRELDIFRGRAMASGAMPTVLSILLIVFGAIAAIQSGVRPQSTVPARVKPAFWVLAAVAVFALTIQTVGLVGATALTSGVVAYQALGRRPAAIIIAATVSVAIALTLALLHLPVPLWPRL
jgi:hypothetical protein